MRIPIIVEPISDHRFRAIGSAPFDQSVEADSPEAAIEKMRELIEVRVAKGAKVTLLEFPECGEPWLMGAGMFRDDPLFEDWQQAIADYRREANQAADIP